ncbi:uncharacterized protein (DUF2062 family) [Runella defluvii]|uniref:Uncharacterized protein (DUF2062 family) n=1 Tax=Runella defluvii TaxID=370973 RepID=A0A7W6ERY2_9BACT|nr:uncharacterized protein (DUF2062 family) [Runella defluvii]
MKFIVIPIFGVVFDVIIDALVFGVISDNMIMKSGLPTKYNPITIGQL